MKRKIALILLTSMLSTQFAYADNISISNSNSNPNVIGSVSTITKNDKNETVINTDNKVLVKKYNSIDSQVKNNIKATIDATFVKDKRFSGLTTIISLEGFIPSNKKISKIDDYKGVMVWPYEYNVKIKSISNNDEVKIVKTTPKNTILEQKVTNTISYTLGGGIEITKDSPKASLNGNYSSLKTISYDQPEYKTVQLDDTNNLSSWKTTFVKTKDGYTLDSSTPYGNEMFMLKRYQNTSTTNFLGDDQLSSLISGGFNPNVGLVLVAPKDINKSVIEVTLTRKMSSYFITWYTAWVGKNNLDSSIDEETMLFEIDWVNHTVKNISEIPDFSEKPELDICTVENSSSNFNIQNSLNNSNIENSSDNSNVEDLSNSSNIENSSNNSNIENSLTQSETN